MAFYFHCVGYIALNDGIKWWIAEWKEAVEICVKTLSHYISVAADEDHEQPQNNWSPGRIFETVIYRVLSRINSRRYSARFGYEFAIILELFNDAA
jgi:hypothetical protein